ncbi:gliding motility-associated C-terminal domain-containing protein [Bizionia echini]|uniref:Gliding motility-associated C-terminal domain-containing protein n=1 Tax=Bizionia echini TaxID=649333 RepID=A0A1I5CH23_9FLAO|nr:T9SS type B sorting domain-containing protein [Bizionia echini]SFN86329.1 gliding motility-associated C-terminal domain-containing protein [Bizionia echini]
MKKILFYTFLICFVGVYGQQQASNWYFGENAGIQFAADGTVSALNDGQLNTVEGCSSISDNNGNLLFYTDGSLVYNSEHNIMVNGTGLLGDLSSSQSAIVVPKPDDSTIYYIFTVGSNQSFTGLKYSIVDMTLDSGRGEITVKNVNLLSQCAEKIAAVLKDCETGAIWVIGLSDINGTSTARMDTFHAFEVTDTGVNPIAVKSTFNRLNISDSRGYLKLSPDGSKVACASMSNGLDLFDFDVTTGMLSNSARITIPGINNRPYGAEFSPTSEILYVTASNDFFGNGDTNPSSHQSVLLQYDLTAGDISNSAFILDSRNGYRSALQLGPDGKIYRTTSETYSRGLPFLSVINNPNILGTDCNFVNNAISLGQNNSTQGLPPFIASFFTEKIDIIGNGNETTFLPLCTGDTYTLISDNIPGATYIWTKDENPLPEADFDLIINDAGIYRVLIDLNNGDCNRLEGEAIVEYFDIPIANPAGKLNVCNDALSADIDLTVRDANILGTQNPSVYEVHYFESQLDAENNENEITGLFTNTLNPTPIFARIHNKNNPNCYDTTSFEVEVFITPTANPIPDQIWCDDATDGDATNGQTDIDLLSFNPMFLDTQSPTDFSVSYHTSQANANSGMSPLPDTYYNQTAFQEEIFVRVENVLNSDCFNTTSFNVVVNPLPPAFNSSLIQCDEDANQDGRTAFNLDEAFGALSGNSTTVSIEYYDNQTDANSGSDMLDPLGYVNTSNPEVVIAKIIDNTTLCYSLAELSLEVSTTQINNYQAPEVCDELDSEDGINTFDLNEITVAIQQDNTITFPVTYYENYNDALLEQNALTTPFNNTIPYNQTIYSRVENNNACYGIGEVTLTINPRPQLEADETVLYCLNTFPDTISLEAGILNDSANNYTYAWSSGQTTSTIAINEIGNYTVTATNNSGCTQTRTITVEPSNIATIESITVRDALRGNNTITVIVSGEGEYEYALFDGDGLLYTSYQTSNEFNNVDPGIYTVSIRDVKNNCGVVDDMVSVIGFPNVFTPNSDGTNDTWNVQGVTALFQPSTRVQIFNRYGKLLKELSPLNGGWDGTYNGEIMPNDDYWFTVKLQDGRIFKSHFTLKR